MYSYFCVGNSFFLYCFNIFLNTISTTIGVYRGHTLIFIPDDKLPGYYYFFLSFDERLTFDCTLDINSFYEQWILYLRPVNLVQWYYKNRIVIIAMPLLKVNDPTSV